MIDLKLPSTTFYIYFLKLSVVFENIFQKAFQELLISSQISFEGHLHYKKPQEHRAASLILVLTKSKSLFEKTSKFRILL